MWADPGLVWFGLGKWNHVYLLYYIRSAAIRLKTDRSPTAGQHWTSSPRDWLPRWPPKGNSARKLPSHLLGMKWMTRKCGGLCWVTKRPVFVCSYSFIYSSLVCTSLGDEREQTKIRLHWKPLATERKEDRLYERMMNSYELSHKQVRRSQEGDTAVERTGESGSVSRRDEEFEINYRNEKTCFWRNPCSETRADEITGETN